MKFKIPPKAMKPCKQQMIQKTQKIQDLSVKERKANMLRSRTQVWRMLWVTEKKNQFKRRCKLKIICVLTKLRGRDKKMGWWHLKPCPWRSGRRRRSWVQGSYIVACEEEDNEKDDHFRPNTHPTNPTCFNVFFKHTSTHSNPTSFISAHDSCNPTQLQPYLSYSELSN